MPWYRVEVSEAPIEFYEAEDEISAIEKYAENYGVNYHYLVATEEPAMSKDSAETSSNK